MSMLHRFSSVLGPFALISARALSIVASVESIRQRPQREGNPSCITLSDFTLLCQSSLRSDLNGDKILSNEELGLFLTQILPCHQKPNCHGTSVNGGDAFYGMPIGIQRRFVLSVCEQFSDESFRQRHGIGSDDEDCWAVMSQQNEEYDFFGFVVDDDEGMVESLLLRFCFGVYDQVVEIGLTKDIECFSEAPSASSMVPASGKASKRSMAPSAAPTQFPTLEPSFRSLRSPFSTATTTPSTPFSLIRSSPIPSMAPSRLGFTARPSQARELTPHIATGAPFRSRAPILKDSDGHIASSPSMRPSTYPSTLSPSKRATPRVAAPTMSKVAPSDNFQDALPTSTTWIVTGERSHHKETESNTTLLQGNLPAYRLGFVFMVLGASFVCCLTASAPLFLAYRRREAFSEKEENTPTSVESSDRWWR